MKLTLNLDFGNDRMLCLEDARAAIAASIYAWGYKNGGVVDPVVAVSTWPIQDANGNTVGHWHMTPPETREPMTCPKCKEGTLQLRTDAYTFRPIFAITATQRPTTTGGTWLDYDMQSGDIDDVSEYQDYYAVTCTECDHEGHEGDFVTEATEPDATA